MRKIFRLVFLFVLVFSFSCEEYGLIFHCPDCTTDEPVRAKLEAKLEAFNFSQTLVQIWEGNLEDSILLGSFQSTSETFYHDVTINKKYTVTATYHISGNTYVAVDSVTPRVKYDKELCDDPCYYIYDRIVDLRLKYTK